ncbi:MAG: dephospho-CoA kinase [Deltaproteobacteria bacterium]|nr:dephospho-CoA kinase [Deltaproteobacteria bacterium]
MEIWGLTGGIACGKSTVSRLLAAHGAAIVDADLLARRVVATGTDGLAAVVARFGPDLLAPDGTLDRKRLGALVFADAQARRDLNAITHPRIAQAAQHEVAQAAARGAPVAIYDAALLVENGLHHGLREVLVVAASEPTQVARLRARDGLTEDEARARIRSQAPLEDKRRAATCVFENDGSLQHLQAQVDRFWKSVEKRLLA